MNVGLITFHYAHHYGAQLQAYALQKAVEKLGFPCEIIDYVRPDTIEGSSLFKKGASPGAILSNIHTLFRLPSFRRRHQRFNSFVNENMKLGGKRYMSIDDLLADPPVYNSYLCGSDQIWNPMIFRPAGLDPAFFMPFAGEKKRIAYAPSFGLSDIPEPYATSLREYLSGFSALSAREQSGSEIIRKLTGREAEVVLDPTMLLDESDWLQVCSNEMRDTPCILCYFISDPTPFSDSIQWISSKLKLPVVMLCGSRKSIPGAAARVYDAGPREFLGLIRNSAFVCTNSFHGTVFSILFRKGFCCFENSVKAKRQPDGSRLFSLLARLGLTDRLIASSQCQSMSERFEPAIDYHSVMEKLGQERQKSLDYLRKALEQA
ncbi:MAG TPA: polysaccharide pyruvyl transferase family protein [Thermoclostridium sp.]|nr:polysaccharide pyruvyl transferase family protein [Clostridiaceae bacterium]HOQ75611.1 polysaccharide pyruvyl transferase family protein [Thermoclostridium sp.]HPU44934.1 polysaccharide pyruvyl transferase family protein [Thermoclostridium sp.]